MDDDDTKDTEAKAGCLLLGGFAFLALTSPFWFPPLEWAAKHWQAYWK